MQLTNDLIRDTMICIESKLESFTDDSGRFNNCPRLFWKNIYEDDRLTSKYLIDDIKYCIIKLAEANLISISIIGRKDKISMLDIDSITWEGHMFLDSIRDEGLWSEIKSKIGNTAKVSISIISKVATEIGITYLKNKLGLV